MICKKKIRMTPNNNENMLIQIIPTYICLNFSQIVQIALSPFATMRKQPAPLGHCIVLCDNVVFVSLLIADW